MDNKTASQINLNRFEQARSYRRRWELSENTREQEQCIANHYVALAHLAGELKGLIEARNRCETPELNELIRFMIGKIRETHLMDFGIELEWRKPEGENE